MNTLKKIFVTFSFLTMLVAAAGALAMPALSHADTTDPSSSGFHLTSDCTGGPQATGGNCDWNALVALINKLSTYMIFISIPLTALGVMYGGFLYLTAGGNSGQTKEARKIMMNVLIGFGLMLGAWLIIHEVYNLLIVPGGDPSHAGALLGN